MAAWRAFTRPENQRAREKTATALRTRMPELSFPDRRAAPAATAAAKWMCQHGADPQQGQEGEEEIAPGVTEVVKGSEAPQREADEAVAPREGEDDDCHGIGGPERGLGGQALPERRAAGHGECQKPHGP